MSLESIRAALPDYARDLKLNLSNVLTATTLTPQQLWGTAVASAVAARNPVLRDAVLADAKAHLTPAALAAAKAAAAIMGMNNIYYRFTHLVGKADYRTLPARLRMNIIGNPGVDRVDFELWSLAVSAINGCGMCLEAHEHEVTAKGIGKEAVQDVVRMASVIHAVAVTLEAEAAAEISAAVAA
ncbi:MAG TPA: carboxymuconolactone decarboxylase family protein [Stellaceae bacterium]|nr:carboxymuconolactone decarboxylase family protein [Stellaceae bacterium]